ncbi:expressed unknown protein [Seminavis robusta]|uniref:Uncharacterized protein n=1 Tax=Seminavis robusta TaxID=568900 RepID=A0A9N8DHI4_9STRA|nr:expressed unknown protein [Seminavis robusta]|eukprot:Sro148_g068210.1 n/a (181) ;mRNA; f:78927-79469
MELLADLRNGDDNIHKHRFRDLWYGEWGDDVQAKMLQAWKDLGHPDHWPTAERNLVALCRQDPTYIQPFALLSKLYCLQGRFQDSTEMCQRILELKPYHFMVIETMVANSFALQQLVESESNHQDWQAKRLPPPSQPKERLEWVKAARQDATRLLEKAKQGNLPRGSEEGVRTEEPESWQ